MISRRRLATLFALLGLVITGVSVADDALAVIGRPLTPLSYAGVARRTVRRAYYY
jgi:hypothetical protein